MRKRRKKDNKIKYVVVAIIAILIGILVFALLSGKKSQDTKIENNKTKKVKNEEKINIVDINSNSRPYAVMINNNKAVWGYQAGVEDSYLTYEIVVEGGITRMMALFKDKDTARIASVRSSRHYYLDYVLENDAIYAHIGWSPQAQDDISKLGINNINADNSSAFTWDNKLTKIDREHRAYTSISELEKAAKKLNYRTTTDKGLLLKYKAKSIDLSKDENAVAANTVKIPFSTSHVTSFVYDSESKLYKRYQNNLEHKDYVTGNQYTAKNIITYKVDNYTLNDGSSKGRQDLKNIGSGEGYYISEGYAIPIIWEKESRTSKTIYKVKSTGKELNVNDGKTFIEIEPLSQNISFE